ncbi:hypothetical protein MMC29_002286 [Sticta canariensis]|nr:hypothetical protein [Sticta canariensis]
MPFVRNLVRALTIALHLIYSNSHETLAISNFTLSETQIKEAEINSTIADIVNEAVRFQRSRYTNGFVGNDEFYHVPSNASHADPGTLLKVQSDVDTTAYTLPPETALSRIMFQSKTYHGTAVAASAYILWPSSPRTQPDGYPIVSLAHGTSGLYGNAAPSHMNNLLQHFLAPYALALQGYVVVAPDYAGLGVEKDAAGTTIDHEYLVNPSAANDLFFSVQAAQSAFPELSKKFVVMGHSQGGGAAWAAAQRQATEPVNGYLGAIAISPVTSVVDLPADNSLKPLFGAAIVPRISYIFPKFNRLDLLTPIAEKRFALDKEIGGGIYVSTVLMSGIDLFQSDWTQNEYMQAWQNLTVNGGKKIGGPLLVIQGGGDVQISQETTDNAVTRTSERFPEAQLQYATFPGVDHDPILSVSQRQWMTWIDDRFAGVEVEKGCQHSVFKSARLSTSYQKELNWFIQPATQAFQTS